MSTIKRSARSAATTCCVSALLFLICAAFDFEASAASSPDESSPPRESEPFVQGELGERIQAYLNAVEERGFSGSIIAAKDSRVVAALSAGYADLERTTPNTPATLFEIASATKPLTATAVIRLAQDGRIELDDPIRIHLPAVPRDCFDITIEHLLNHTSGIPGSNSQGGGNDFNAVLPVFLRGGPQHEPGTHFEYWNQGYAILTEVIHRASGTSYTEDARSNIFEPAGMTLTRFTGDDAPEGAIVAVGRCSLGPARSALDHPYGSYGFQYRGMGGIVTNVWDLWQFDRALREHTIINADLTKRMFTPGPGNYGLGWRIAKSSGRTVHSHTGRVRGFNADMRRYADEDAFIAVLANSDQVPSFEIAGSIETILFGDDPMSHSPLSRLSREQSDALVGTYRDGRGNVLTISDDTILVRGVMRWAGNFPDTNAVLGLNDDGEIALDDRSGVEIPITITARDAESNAATQLSILGQSYERVSD
ncbi:MAG: class A beta-lactamase-related serine hydrolase [Phycisphaerales bacterium]|nr:MAG: class A beta-lactamase-related serine hydrolase [Phycisphaerales bacterium]